MRSRAAIIRVNDNEVDYLLTDLALQVTIPFGYAAKAPAIRGPFEQDMMPNELLTCGVRNYNFVGMDLTGKPRKHIFASVYVPKVSSLVLSGHRSIRSINKLPWLTGR